jgi:hypothetical protein
VVVGKRPEVEGVDEIEAGLKRGNVANGDRHQRCGSRYRLVHM